jgi:hypothetical protein
MVYMKFTITVAGTTSASFGGVELLQQDLASGQGEGKTTLANSGQSDGGVLMKQYEGQEALKVLRQLAQDASRPFVVIFTSNPKYPGGMIYEGVRVQSIARQLNDNGETESACVSVTMDSHYLSLQWYADPSQAKDDQYVIRGVQTFHEDSRW